MQRTLRRAVANRYYSTRAFVTGDLLGKLDGAAQCPSGVSHQAPAVAGKKVRFISCHTAAPQDRLRGYSSLSTALST